MLGDGIGCPRLGARDELGRACKEESEKGVAGGYDQHRLA
jgi:hypothetical protein